MNRYRIEITGIVQGIGFRPFVYNLAVDLNLKGWVNNTGSKVIIEVEGKKSALDAFVTRLQAEAPPLSVIKTLEVRLVEPVGCECFQIMESVVGEKSSIYISPDVATCAQCTEELFDEKNRRFLYPFINCTNCGPRFTIVRDVPYDRERTTMDVFPLCGECAEEYAEPSDRRYHAQPVSCYRCGPVMQLFDQDGKELRVENAVDHTLQLLAEGKIVAIKGLGGYHLACDARNAVAVMELRRRKLRDDKPFAVMARNTEIAEKYCFVGPEEKCLLESEKRPIVLLKKKREISLPEDIAPRNAYLGVMLPYTPVHLLLLKPGGPLELLVMTSGNRSSEPICYKDDEAIQNLCGIADYFLAHNREIHTRVDDSVVRIFRGREYMLRRSRGYVPDPVTCSLPEALDDRHVPVVLATGGELKNTFCLNKGKEFYISHHIGDLENFETLQSFEEGIGHFQRLFAIKPEVVAYDPHPGYLSAQYVHSLTLKRKIAIQHHHAHIASCMADNGLDGEVIGVALDGTGYGEDGNIWGGEFFSGGYHGFTRQGHLAYVKMPGGEAAIKEPWRMAVAYLHHTFGGQEKVGICFTSIDREKQASVLEMLEKNIHSPLTSSMGRLFDAVSALLGIRYRIHYEGQAAVELEYASDGIPQEGYRFHLRDNGEIFTVDTADMIRGIVRDIGSGEAVSRISSAFHSTVANMVVEGCSRIREKTGLDRVVLSGGVFQNMILLEWSVQKLESTGFKVYTHHRVPSNDGGVALGQAVMAAVGVRLR